MNARFIIIRGIPTQDPAQVRLPEYDHVVEQVRATQEILTSGLANDTRGHITTAGCRSLMAL
jgi:hypothetical protein